MADDLNIRRALEQKLATVTDLPTVAWENTSFQPDMGTPYVRPTIIWGGERKAAVGVDGQILSRGLFLIDLFYPSGVGSAGQDAMASAIKEAFYPGLLLTEGGQRIHIQYSEREPSLIEDPWIQCQVTVSWYAYV